MAVPYEQQTDEDKKAQQSGEPQKLGTESAVIQQGPQAPTSDTQKGSGQFTNLQSYLEQNAGSHQGEDLAGKVGGVVNQAQQAQTQADQSFRGDVDKSTVNYNQDLENQIKDNPVSVAQNKDLADQFSNEINANYGGPKDFTSSSYYGDLYGKVDEANQQSKASETEPGRFSLLQNYYNRPDYTQGQQKLDQLLVQNDPNSKAAFDNVRAQNTQQQQGFSDLQNSLNQYAKQGAQTTQNTNQKANDQINQQLYDTQNQIKDYAAPAYQQQLEGMQKLSGGLNNRDLSGINPDQLQAMGLNSGQSVYGADFSKYFTPDTVSGMANYVKPEDYAKYAALSQLSGNPNDFLPDQSQVGTEIGKPGYSFDQGGFNDYIQSQKTGLQNDLANTYFDPFSSTPGDSSQPGYFYSGANAQGHGLNIQDPGLISRIQRAEQQESSGPNSLREQEIKEVQDKIKSIQNQYGLYDTLKGRMG